MVCRLGGIPGGDLRQLVQARAGGDSVAAGGRAGGPHPGARGGDVGRRLSSFMPTPRSERELAITVAAKTRRGQLERQIRECERRLAEIEARLAAMKNEQ
jgi:hypothetical protein